MVPSHPLSFLAVQCLAPKVFVTFSRGSVRAAQVYFNLSRDVVPFQGGVIGAKRAFLKMNLKKMT